MKYRPLNKESAEMIEQRKRLLSATTDRERRVALENDIVYLSNGGDPSMANCALVRLAFAAREDEE